MIDVGGASAAGGSAADANGAAPKSSDEHDEDDGLGAELARMTVAIEEFHRRSAHRETVIDRLHEENQELRSGMRRVVLEPVVTDLLRLYDGLSRQAARLELEQAQAGFADLFASFAEDVELALDRCGMEVFTAEPREEFSASRHLVAGFEPCEDPSLHNTVADVVAKGLRERETGRIRRAVKARFHRYEPPIGQVAADPPEPSVQEAGASS
jgi:molecular chaperone GrpE (heat shock protein)